MHPSGEGGGRYLWNLIGNLLFEPGPHEYFLYLDGTPQAKPQSGALPFRFRFLKEDVEKNWEGLQGKLSQMLRQERIDLFHSHYRRFAVEAPCKTVVTIHDTIPLLSPHKTLSPDSRKEEGRRLGVAVRKADHVIVSSRYTQQQLIERLAIRPERTTQIYPGCSRIFRPLPLSEAARRVRHQFPIKRPYLLSVGTLLPRKNYPLLVRAFRKRLRKTHDLVIIGKPSWWGKRLLRLIQDDPAIHYLGQISDRDLHSLYVAAECLAYPSQEEGFGFPPLEAMACGTPVVASRSSSIPEVVGDAGILVEPHSAEALEDALTRALKDQRLRSRLRQKGFRRVQKFRWEETAKKTLAVYHRLMQNSHHGTR